MKIPPIRLEDELGADLSLLKPSLRPSRSGVDRLDGGGGTMDRHCLVDAVAPACRPGLRHASADTRIRMPRPQPTARLLCSGERRRTWQGPAN